MPRKLDTAEAKERNRVYQNEWYHANKESALLTRKKRHKKLSDEVRKYKEGKGCANCGESHFACLEFHHTDPETKECNPQDLVKSKGWSIDKIIAELSTMIVLCANCHRKLHHEWMLATGSRLIRPNK